MKPLYVLSVNAIAAPHPSLAINSKHTFHFHDLEDRVAVADWAKGQGWEVTTDVIFPVSRQAAMETVLDSLREIHDQFRRPASGNPSQGA